jgi:flagellar hook-associated protein 1 FlgK
MISTFAGIEMGKKSLVTHQAAMNVVGHNVSNQETEGYSRQRVSLQVFDPLYIPGLTRELTPGQVGQGTEVQKILRARDMLLDDRILGERNGHAYWSTMSEWLYQVEGVHNEPTDRSIMFVLDQFWSAWQELSANPDEVGPRETVREYGQALARHINHNFQSLKAIRDNIENGVRSKVEQINDLGMQIADLNEQILRSESVGDNPNDLWDRRDLLTQQLSDMVNINIGRSDRDEFQIFIGGMRFVQGSRFERLQAVRNPDNEGYSDIRWSVEGSLLVVESGELKGLLDARDIELKGQIDALDDFTANLTDMVNTIHREGFGLNLRTGLDFFASNPLGVNDRGDHDFNRDGLIDGTALYRIRGTRSLDKSEPVGIDGTLTLNDGITVQYGPADTLSSIMTRVNNAGSDISMFLDGEDYLVVRSDTSSQIISHLEDSGELLTGYSGVLRDSGAAGAFDRGQPGMADRVAGSFLATQALHPSSWIRLDERVAGEVESIAAGAGTDTDGDGTFDLSMGAGNGDNALRIAGLRFQKVMIGGSQTLNEFYQALINNTGLRGETAQNETDNRSILVENLENMRKSISGVNIDEELVSLVKFQHGYAAAARFVSMMDEMLDLLINRMQ